MILAKDLLFGYVSRWTESNVWIKPYANLGSNRKTSKNDIQLRDYRETLVLNEESNENDLIVLALSK